MNNTAATFASLDELAQHLRDGLQKKYILFFAYNSTGKTRLSMAFKELDKQEGERDTLYFNAFTEDLFYWDNDLEGDAQRVLRMNTDSRFFDGLQSLEMENRIRPLLGRYADFDFLIDYDRGAVTFVREVQTGEHTETIDHIDDPDGILHARLVNILSHGNYSLYEPQEMMPENKEYFLKILRDFMNNYRFNSELFPPPTQGNADA